MVAPFGSTDGDDDKNNNNNNNNNNGARMKDARMRRMRRL